MILKRKILLDIRWVMPPRTGVGNYCLNLISEIAKITNNVSGIVYKNLPDNLLPNQFHLVTTNIKLTQHPFTDFFEQFWIPYYCWKNKIDVFVSFEGRIPVLGRKFKKVSYIYDVSTFTIKNSHSIKYTLFLKLCYWISIKFSTKIITISNTVKNQICGYSNLNPKKVFVAYPGNSQLISKGFPTPIFILQNKKFFIMVGVTNKRKNLQFVLKAFNHIRAQNYDVCLALTGNQKLIEVETKFVTKSDNVFNLGFVTDSELRWLYENSLGLIFASLDEGFGIPILDAVQFNTPILCSKIPIFQEILISKESFFGLDNTNELEKIILKRIDGIIPNAKLNQDFNWNISATNFLKCINEI